MPQVRKLTTSLSLPTIANEPPETINEYNDFIYGRKQWGKSTFAAQHPGAINVQLERGRRGLAILQVSPKTIEETLGYTELFLESKHDRIIYDTVDRFYDAFLVKTCRDISNGAKVHPSEFGNEGYAIWDLVKTNFEAVFESIIDAGKTFTVISHDKKVQQKDRDGQEWVRQEPTCKPAAWKIGQSLCDFVYHCDFLNGDRIITIRDLDNTTLASCNPDIECFLDCDTGEPISRFRIPNNKANVFQTVQDAFDNKLHDYSWSPPKKELTPKKGLAKTSKEPVTV